MASILDLAQAHNFHCQLNGVKMLLNGVENSLSLHADNGKTCTLVFVEGPINWLNNTLIESETNYSDIFTKSRKKMFLILHYNMTKSLLHANVFNIQ